MSWTYKGETIKEITDFPPNSHGFVYVITHLPSKKKYIGKKILYFSKKVKIGKRELAKMQDLVGRRPTYKLAIKESDWKNYYGSQKELKSLLTESKIKDFKREILKVVPNKKLLTWVKKNRGKIKIFNDSLKAATGSDVVFTDKVISMNDKVNKVFKKKTLKPYQVNKKLMSKANSDAIFMHCLPVGRGEEVTNDVIDGKLSVVWRQALNRVHAQKSIIKWCLD